MNRTLPSLLMTTIAIAAIACAGCNRPSPPQKPEIDAPIKTTPTPPATDESPSVEFDGDSAASLIQAVEDGKDKWVQIVTIQEGHPGAWITGKFEKPNRIVINVEGADQFKINTATLEIDWTKRVVLRINNVNSELTKKKNPRIQFKRSPGGGWYVVDMKTSQSKSNN